MIRSNGEFFGLCYSLCTPSFVQKNDMFLRANHRAWNQHVP